MQLWPGQGFDTLEKTLKAGHTHGYHGLNKTLFLTQRVYGWAMQSAQPGMGLAPLIFYVSPYIPLRYFSMSQRAKALST